LETFPARTRVTSARLPLASNKHGFGIPPQLVALLDGLTRT
jgi:hypothetical protein